MIKRPFVKYFIILLSFVLIASAYTIPLFNGYKNLGNLIIANNILGLGFFLYYIMCSTYIVYMLRTDPNKVIFTSLITFFTGFFLIFLRPFFVIRLDYDYNFSLDINFSVVAYIIGYILGISYHYLENKTSPILKIKNEVSEIKQKQIKITEKQDLYEKKITKSFEKLEDKITENNKQTNKILQLLLKNN